MGRRGVPIIEWDEFVSRTGSEAVDVVALALNGLWFESSERKAALEADRGTRTSFRWVKALDIAQWHHYDGETITACGRRLEVTRQRAQQLLDLLVSAHPFDAPERASAQEYSRSRVLARVFSEAVDIIRAEPGIKIGDLAGRIGCSVTDLHSVLGGLSSFVVNPAWSARQGRSRWSDADIVALLKRMSAANGGEPLTKRVYEELSASDEFDAPSHPLINKRFGSWSAALSFAGLPSVGARQDYSWAHSQDEALGNMVDFVLETGKTSAGEYRHWLDSHPEAIKVPQAVIGRGKSWTSALSKVFEALCHGAARPRYQRMIDDIAQRRASELSEQYGVEFALRRHVLVPAATDPIPGEE